MSVCAVYMYVLWNTTGIAGYGLRITDYRLLVTGYRLQWNDAW